MWGRACHNKIDKLLLDTCRAKGGATTLNAYAAWVADADTRADLSKPEGTVVHLRPGSSAARDFDEPFRPLSHDERCQPSPYSPRRIWR